jgi:hypothetical protein
MRVEINRLAVKDYGKWDQLLEKSPQSELYHTSHWLRIAEKHTNTELFLLLAVEGSEIIGGIPLFLHRKYRGVLKRLMSPPYESLTNISNLGPVFANYDDLKQNKKDSRLKGFQSSFDEYVNSKIRPAFTDIMTTPSLTDIRPFQWAGYSIKPLYTYIGDIRDKELNRKRIAKKSRDGITKMETSGIEVQEGRLEDYKYVYNSVFERYKEQNIKIKIPWQYLLDIYNEFYPNNLRIFIALYQQEIIGGCICLIYKDKLTTWMGGVGARLRGLPGNTFLHWKIIEWAADQGVKYFDLMGANNSTISDFKSEFGFELKIYFNITKASLKYKTLRRLA